MHESLLSTMTLAQLRPTDSGPATNAAVSATPESGVIVQSSTTQPSTTEPTPKSSPWAGVVQFAPLILVFGLLYLFMFRGQKKTEKTRKQMLAQMKKGDEVMT